MLFNLVGTLESGETIPGISGPISTPSYQVSAADLAVIMAAAGSNPQALGVSPNSAVATLGTPAGVLNAIATKIVADIVRMANGYQHQVAAQAAIVGIKPVSITPTS